MENASWCSSKMNRYRFINVFRNRELISEHFVYSRGLQLAAFGYHRGSACAWKEASCRVVLHTIGSLVSVLHSCPHRFKALKCNANTNTTTWGSVRGRSSGFSFGRHPDRRNHRPGSVCHCGKTFAGRWMSAKSGQVGAFFCAPKCSTQQPMTFVLPGKSRFYHSPFTVQMAISWGHGEFQKRRIFT